MLNCPCTTYKVGEYVINRYYNTKRDIFGGKDYVDIVVSPYMMMSLDEIEDKKDRQMVQEYMSTVPTKL